MYPIPIIVSSFSVCSAVRLFPAGAAGAAGVLTGAAAGTGADSAIGAGAAAVTAAGGADAAGASAGFFC